MFGFKITIVLLVPLDKRNFKLKHMFTPKNKTCF